MHSNDLTFNENSDVELKKYKVGEKIDVKILQIQPEEQKIRVSHRATLTDPFSWFDDKKAKQAITVKIISTDNKGLVVRPEGCEMDFRSNNQTLDLKAVKWISLLKNLQ